MKVGRRVKLWWAANVFWLVIISILAIIIETRQVDGTGGVQTPEIRVVSFIIVGATFLFILAIQLIWFYFVRKRIRLS